MSSLAIAVAGILTVVFASVFATFIDLSEIVVQMTEARGCVYLPSLPTTRLRACRNCDTGCDR